MLNITAANDKAASKQSITINAKKQQQIEHEYEGTIPVQNGHFVWEIEVKTREIRRALYQTVTHWQRGGQTNKKLIMRPDCVYIPALNAKNAMKKFDDNPSQSHYFFKSSPMNLSDIKLLKPQP